MHSVGVHGGVVSPLILLFALLGIILLLMYAYRAMGVRERLFHTWGCGYRTSAKTQYTATGFAGPIRRFFDWLYKPHEQFSEETAEESDSQYGISHYEVHVKPLFEATLYRSVTQLVHSASYWGYRFSHFVQSRYAAIIFNLLLLVLFSYRIFAHEFSWATLILEATIMLISVRILVIGDKS